MENALVMVAKPLRSIDPWKRETISQIDRGTKGQRAKVGWRVGLEVGFMVGVLRPRSGIVTRCWQVRLTTGKNAA